MQMAPRRPSQSGFSLIELMIAMTLGLVLMAGVGALSLNMTRSHRALNQAGQQIEHGRHALAILIDDLEHAGFFGQFAPSLAGLTLPLAAPDPCVTSSPPLKNYADSLLLPITGTCGTTLTNRLANTNMLVLLRANTTITPPGNIMTGNTYIQTTSSHYIIGTACANNMLCANFISNAGGTTNAFSLQQPNGSPADLRQFHVHVYYIRSYSQSGDNIPTLVRKSPADNDNLAQPVVEGIENMQLQYGVDDNLDGAPDRYLATPVPLPATDWANIVTVRVNLLARSVDADFASPADNKTYDLGNLMLTPGGHYRRHVFSGVARIVNISSRREQ